MLRTVTIKCYTSRSAHASFSFYECETSSKLSTGTPPHAWRRPSFPVSRADSTGNTPICVGKSAYFLEIPQGLGEHPHMRGENLTTVAADLAATGTPPHAWGRLFLVLFIPDSNRNTPTCVGKTEHWIRSVEVRNTPRVCGEDSMDFLD